MVLGHTHDGEVWQTLFGIAAVEILFVFREFTQKQRKPVRIAEGGADPLRITFRYMTDEAPVVGPGTQAVTYTILAIVAIGQPLASRQVPQISAAWSMRWRKEI